MRIRFAVMVLAAFAGGLGTSSLFAQTWPTKPLRYIVPFPPGGGPDLAARAIGEKLAARLGKPVVVDNKPGAGALIGAGVVAKSPADGHTLLFTPNTVVISPHVLPAGAGGGINVARDLVPVIAPATTPLVLVAHPSLAATRLQEALERVDQILRMIPDPAGIPVGLDAINLRASRQRRRHMHRFHHYRRRQTHTHHKMKFRQLRRL